MLPFRKANIAVTPCYLEFILSLIANLSSEICIFAQMSIAKIISHLSAYNLMVNKTIYIKHFPV